MKEIKKLYIVLDENNVITKGFIQNTEFPQKGVWFKKSANFDESVDFENAIILENVVFEDIKIGKSTYINGVFNKNEELGE